MELLTGDVLFFTGDGMAQKAVKRFQSPSSVDGESYSHVAIALGTTGFVFSPEWRVSINTLPYMMRNSYTGVTVMRNKKFFKKKQNRKAFFHFVHARFRARYDWLQIVGFFIAKVTGQEWFARHIQMTKIEVCSTMIPEFFEEIGEPICEEKFVGPNKLLEVLKKNDDWKMVYNTIGGV